MGLWFLYIVPAVLIRYLFLGKPMNRGPSIGLSVVLFFVIYVTTIFYWKLSGETSPSQMGRSLPWVLAASIWSYFILRAKGENAEPVEASTLQQKTITPQKKQDEIETIPAPRAERVEPVKTEELKTDSSHYDEQFYEQVAAEISDGTIKQGLWLKAETKAEGNKDKARLLYIEWRVQQLTEEADKAKQAKAWEKLIEAEAQAKREREEEEPIKDSKAAVESESAKVIEAAIRKAAEKPFGELTKADYEKVKQLQLIDKKLTELHWLENLTQLKVLDLQKNKLTSMRGLENLTQLVGLTLSFNQLSDVKGLENLTQLRTLSLGNNQLTEVRGIEKLPQLEYLWIEDNQLSDVAGLERLTKLESLNLDNNQLTEVRGIEKLTQLEVLYLRHNKLTEVPKGIEKLTKLRWFGLTGNIALTEAKCKELIYLLPKCLTFTSYDDSEQGLGEYEESNQSTNLSRVDLQVGKLYKFKPNPACSIEFELIEITPTGAVVGRSERGLMYNWDSKDELLGVTSQSEIWEIHEFSNTGL